MVIIIGGIGESILDFVFTYFINLITFNSECYITFAYIISGGFFTKISKSIKKKIPRTNCKVVIFLIYIRNFDLQVSI